MLAQILLRLVQAKNGTLRELTALLQQHPNRDIFAFLPGAGELLAPALLSKFGDDRQRFPTPASLQALASTCPVTDASGKRKVVKFRCGCDREFRWIVQQWALNSLTESVWAQTYWQQLRSEGTSDNQAYRCLGNRWLPLPGNCGRPAKPMMKVIISNNGPCAASLAADY